MSDAQASPDALTLDVRNMLCPMPVIKTGERVATLTPGDELTIIATDPGTLHDVPAWCRVHGHTVLETTHQPRNITVRIRVEAQA